MNADDRTRLTHMLEAAREAVDFVAGLSSEEFAANKMLVRALSYDLEIVGEAARHVSDETKAATPDLPWAVMRGMRNRLVHAYWDVDVDVLWVTVTESLPALIPQLERLLATSPETASKPPA